MDFSPQNPFISENPHTTDHELCITQYGHCYADNSDVIEEMKMEKLWSSDKYDKSMDL